MGIFIGLCLGILTADTILGTPIKQTVLHCYYAGMGIFLYWMINK